MQGNKGEWTEAYVFLRLLATGELKADHVLADIPTSTLEIIQIIRREAAGARNYQIREGDVHVVEAATDNLILKMPRADFIREADALFTRIKSAKGRSHKFPASEKFLQSIDVNSLSAPSSDKSDIHVVVYDFKTGQTPTLGYSIKSAIGRPATLFNPATGTNFIYKVIPPEGTVVDIDKINTETYRLSEEKRELKKISLRIQRLAELGCELQFQNIESKNLSLNLSLIDTDLPVLLSNLILYRYQYDTKDTAELSKILVEKNPLNYDLSKGHEFYQHKLKKFLADAALGMTPEKIWNGVHDTTGGFILVRPNGQLGCYHIYNKNDFDTYLINGTRLEQPSTGEDADNPGHADPKASKNYYFGWIYDENGELFIKMNLQIRFL